MQTAEEEIPDSLSTEATTNMRSRRQRVSWMLGFVNSHGSKWSRKKLLARYGLKYGVGPDTANRYIKELLDAEYVVEYQDPQLGVLYVMSIPDCEAALERERNGGKGGNKVEKET